MRRPKRIYLLKRSQDRFAAEPASVGNAVRVVVAIVAASVFAGSLIIWLLDKRDFPTYGEALWFSLQTVTTVGYGDATPTTLIGRIVAAVVMVLGIGFITVITAAVTSTFVESARRKRQSEAGWTEQEASERLAAQVDDIGRRLDRIERHLGVEDAPVGDQPG